MIFHKTKATNTYHLAPLWLGCLLILGISGCSTLPKQYPQPQQYSYQTDTNQTTLAQIFQPLRNQHPNLTGYHILYDPLEALATRIHLIDKAEKTLDLQYYIWDNDRIGALALHSIINAANRGVKVRLLIDDNNAKQMEGIFLALDQHKNIDVKLYNPYGFRQYRGLDILLDLKRVNRRMHNKSFIVDNQVSLIGGRNMSDQYYNLSDKYQFSDVDIILVGAASDEIIHSFDDYWNDDYAFPVRQIVDHNKYPLRYEGLKQQLDTHYQEASVQNYLDLAYRSKAFENWLSQETKFDWTTAEVVKDSPSKIKSRATKEEHLNFQLLKRLQEPDQSIDIVSAYFVPEKIGMNKLNEMAQNGINVRVLTNSFAANDVSVVHAFYSKYRKDLLKNNVQLYEFLYAPDQENLNSNIEELSKKAKVSLKGLSRSSLHAKLMAIDEKQVFIGSFNFDPRSSYLNTEIGVLLDSPTLAKGVHETMDNHLAKYAYKLVLDANNNINWQVPKPNGEIKTLTKEPKMKWYHKVLLKLTSWLPIEGLM